MMFCELIYHFIKAQLSFAYQQWLELLCNVYYWKFLLIIFAVTLHHQALLSCGANCYISKLEYQSFLVQSFWKKLKIINFQFFFHSWSLKCRTFLRMTHMCFLRNITKSFRRVTSQNTTFGIFFSLLVSFLVFFSIILSICCYHLFLYYLTKPLWNCESTSQIYCSGGCSQS